MSTGSQPSPTEKIETNPYHAWAARFWHGMLLTPWLRLLARNRFAVHPLRWGLCITITGCSVLNSIMSPVQQLIFGRKLRKTHILHEPIFIVGHWRSGTTLLHELLVLDERFTFPTTYECMAPSHFLISSWFVTKLSFLLPTQRPMDNMVTGFHRPQEDEFALCNLGVPSPYLTMTFPNRPPQATEYLDLHDLTPSQLQQWKDALQWFLTRVTFRNPKRIVLKSPPHTARIKALLELFPDARFVHIVRDPYVLFASNVKLWKTLYKFQALQEPRYEGLEEYVFSMFEKMYAAFDRDRDLIPADRLYEVRYEDLVREPVEQIRRLYEQLGLGDFEKVQPKLAEYFQATGDYKTNKYQIEPQLREQIDRRWGPFMRKHGYCQEDASATPLPLGEEAGAAGR